MVNLNPFDINLLKLAFAVLTFVIVVIGSLVNTVEKHLPTFIQASFRYGKFSYKGKEILLRPIEVPKRWFRHFYVFAVLFSVLAILHTFNLYFLSGKQCQFIVSFLDLMASSSRKVNVSGLSSFVALVLLTLQACHRFYETWFISVYSNTKINIMHYLIGYFHYFGAVLAILSEAPGFVNVNEYAVNVKLADCTLWTICGALLFLWACFHQYRSAVILANLRKNDNGKVVNYQHKIPHGDWFQYVSSPHLLAEVVMYFGILLIVWGNGTWPIVFLWVFSNQVESALLSHWWYQATFPNYPKDRKAIIPYVL